MDATEREFVLKHLCDNRDRLLGSVEGLSPAQVKFRAAQEEWSIADCVEHIALVENRIYTTIQRVLQEAPPEIRPEVQGKVERMMRAVVDRSTKVKAPEPVVPRGEWSSFSEIVDRFQNARSRTLKFAGETEADLHERFFPHFVFKDLDCYQWLVFLGLHAERHIRQLEEIKSGPQFPAA